MFKKRTRPAAVRDKATIDEEISVEEASSNVASGSGTTAVEEDEGYASLPKFPSMQNTIWLYGGERI